MPSLPRTQRQAASFAKFDARNGAFAPSLNIGALIFGCFWYFRYGLWKKGWLLFLVACVTAVVPVKLFILAHAAMITLPIQAASGTKMGPGGSVLGASADEQALAIMRTFACAAYVGVMWYFFRRLWRRCILLLAIGFAGQAILQGLAVPALWLAAGVLADYDAYLAARAAATALPAS